MQLSKCAGDEPRQPATAYLSAQTINFYKGYLLVYSKNNLGENVVFLRHKMCLEGYFAPSP